MKLGIVIPCYNEEEVLAETSRRVMALLSRLVASGKISGDSKLWFVDDGSTDGTWPLIERFSLADNRICGIKLSRNCGHQNALIAGLFTAHGDAIVSVDADLQDDVNAIEEMVDHFKGGVDVVYGVRRQRETDTLFKRLSAQAFYRLMSALGAESVYNHADYRLLSRRAIDALKQYPEVNLYLRGIIPLIGFKSAVVHYDRMSRFAGESKYPLRRMIGLALDAITSFSVVPLRLITFAGFVIFVCSMAVTVWVIWVRIFTDEAVPGWASTVLPMYFLGGVQIFCIGVVGEYLGKSYTEMKSRPRFFIERTVSDADLGMPADELKVRAPARR